VEYLKDNRITKYWRPAIAWSYAFICLFDFFLAPILFPILSWYLGFKDVIIWKPLTLEGGGLYHVAMGAIIGVSSWSRGQVNAIIANKMTRQDIQQSVDESIPVEEEENYEEGDINPPPRRKRRKTVKANMMKQIME
jgi:hypothetical protein